tara:strand:- start:184 stop:936 length:753 start_codon:yes stop_codon:yes gene_type:complete
MTPQYTKTVPRKWTESDIKELKIFKEKGMSNFEISKKIDRSEVAIQIKWKRLNKVNNTYNKNHVEQKYGNNLQFLSFIKPNTILDLYAGENSYYQNLQKELIDLNENYIKEVVSNDKNKDFTNNTYNLDSLKLLCKFYVDNKKFDLIDLDPFGSAYECFDLSIKLAKKGIVITYGEMGHKRFKRLDYVKRFYNINNLDDFHIDNIIEETKKIALKNKKILTPMIESSWQNISRVYYKISELKIDAWGKNV